MSALIYLGFALLAGLMMTRIFSRWRLTDVTAFLAAASPNMYDTADAYLRDCIFYDIDMKSALAFTEDDVYAVPFPQG